MSKRQDRFDRFAAVLREFQTAIVAIGLLEERIRANPSFLSDYDLRPRDARNLANHLEATFLIRLYAEFESGLREIWRSFFRRVTHPPMMDLLVALATLRFIPQDCVQEVDAVRTYRNSLVHELVLDAENIAIAHARRRLCWFWSFMPLDW